MASRTDYTNALDVQNYLQRLVNKEAELDWARREERQKISIAGLPSKMYEKEKVRPGDRWFLKGLLP